MKAELERLIEGFRNSGIDYLLTVPASGFESLYRSYDDIQRCIYATREEEAIAIATGLSIGGYKPAVVMQQSGVGNALNAVFTLADAYDVYFPIVVYDRGEFDPNPIQRISSAKTQRVLVSCDHAAIDWGRPDASVAFLDCLNRHVRWIIFQF